MSRAGCSELVIPGLVVCSGSPGRTGCAVGEDESTLGWKGLCSPALAPPARCTPVLCALAAGAAAPMFEQWIKHSLFWTVTSCPWGKALPFSQINLHPLSNTHAGGPPNREDAKCAHTSGCGPTPAVEILSAGMVLSRWDSLTLSKAVMIGHTGNTPQAD